MWSLGRPPSGGPPLLRLASGDFPKLGLGAPASLATSGPSATKQWSGDGTAVSQCTHSPWGWGRREALWGRLVNECPTTAPAPP